LTTKDNIAGYMTACMDEGIDEPAFIALALGVVVRARYISHLARETGSTREGLYKAVSGVGNPRFATVLNVVKALGFKMTPTPA
jgi:probable addiction module antidote protein